MALVAKALVKITHFSAKLTRQNDFFRICRSTARISKQSSQDTSAASIGRVDRISCRPAAGKCEAIASAKSCGAGRNHHCHGQRG
jgi:hypothetical protein